MKTFRALSALIQHPGSEMIGALDEIETVLDDEGIAPHGDRVALGLLIADLRSRDIYDLQETWHNLFDRTRSLSLHLFEHVHGDSRDRGQALVDLKTIYEEKGLSPDAKELPDFLPLFLEYLSLLPLDEARCLLGETAHVLTALAERLAKRKSPYQAILRALVAIADAKPDETALAALRAENEPAPDDLAALDAAWEEEAVTFGPQAGCRDEFAAKLRQGRRPAPGVENQIRTARENSAAALHS